MQELERFASSSPGWLYVVLFAYAFIKTGPLPIAAGYASTLGWLDAVPAVFAVWWGAVAGDLVRFELGRRFGPGALRRFPKWEGRTGMLTRVIARHAVWICLLKRYAKGLRTPLSLAFGLSAMSRGRFAITTLLTSAIWAASFVGLGVAAGDLLDEFWSTRLVVASFATMAGLLLALSWLVNREMRRLVDASATATAMAP